MAGGKEIRAGGAFVEIMLRDKLQAGLKRAATQLRAFATMTSAIGAGLVGASAGLLTPLAVAVADFTKFGATMDDIAQRTGLSAAAVSELAHAANQSGTDVETLEKGVRKMQQTLVSAASGSAEAKDSLAGLGLTVADLRGLSPDQQLAKLADALANVKDPSVRTAAAMGVFGKAGAQLIPMLAGGAEGLNKMREQARALGIAITNQDAKAAAALDDAFDVLTSTTKGLTRQIGAALAPVLTDLVEHASEAVATVTRFVRENRGLVTLVAIAAVGIGVAGTALLGLGGVLYAASIAVGMFASAWGIAATAMFFLPKSLGRVVGLMSAGLRGIVATSQRSAAGFAGAWQRAGRTFTGWLGDIASRSGTIRSAIQPLISNAVAIGRRLGTALATGVQAAVPQVGQAATAIVAGLRRAANAAPAIWNSLRQSAAAFGRGFTGDIGLFTTRANSVLWSFGSTARAVFDRAAQYGRVLRPLFDGVVATIASRVVPVWQATSQRILVATSSVSARVSLAWQSAASRVTATMSGMSATISSAWRSTSQRVIGVAASASSAVKSSWQGMGARITAVTAGTWNRIAATISQAAERSRSIVGSSYRSIAALTARQGERIAIAAKQAVSRIASAWQRLPSQVRAPLGQLATTAVRSAQSAVVAVSNSVGRLATAWQSAVSRIKATMSGLSAATRVVASVWQSATQRIVAASQDVGARISATWSSLRTRLAATSTAIGNTVAATWQGVGRQLTATVSRAASAWQRLPSVVRGPLSQLTAMLGQQSQRAVGLMAAAFQQIPRAATVAWQQIRVAGTSAATTAASAWLIMSQRIASAAQLVGTRIGSTWSSVQTRIAAATSAIGSTVSATWQSVSNRFAATASRVAAAWQRLPSMIGAPLSQLATVLGQQSQRAIGVMADAFRRVPTVAGAAWQQIRAAATSAATAIGSVWPAMLQRVSATWQSVGNQVTTAAAGTWGRVAATVAQSVERTRTAVSTAYSSLVATAGQQWQRIANVGQTVATRVSAVWQRLPSWVRGPISQVATMLGQDSRRAVGLVAGAFRQIPAAATAAWQRIRVAGTSAATAVAAVTRTAMQRAFAATRVAGVAAFNGLRRAGAAAIGTIGKVGGRMGGAFSAVTSALTMLMPSGGGVVGSLLLGLPLIVSAVGAVGSALVGLLNPVTLVIAAVAGAVAAWMKWSDSGQQATSALRPAFDALKQVFVALWNVAKKTFGGLSDALAAGNLKVAAQVLWAGLKAAWYTGVAEVQKVWPTLQSAASSVWQQISAAGASVVSYLGQVWSQLPQSLTGPLGAVGQSVGTVLGWIGEQLGSLASSVGETFSGIATAIGQGEFSLAGEIAWTSIKLAFAQGTAWVTNLWSEFTTGLAMIWDGVVTSIRTAWSAAVTWIAKALLSVVGAVQNGLAKLAEWDPTGLIQKLSDAMSFDVQGSLKVLNDDQQRFAGDQARQRQQRDDQRGADLLARQAATEEQLAKLRAAREEALAKARDLAANDRPAADKANDAMAELNAAIVEAAKAKRLFDADAAAGELAPVADDLDVRSKQISAVGTFNPFAIQGLGADSLAQRTAVAAEGINNKMGLLLRKADNGGVQFA